MYRIEESKKKKKRNIQEWILVYASMDLEVNELIFFFFTRHAFQNFRPPAVKRRNFLGSCTERH